MNPDNLPRLCAALCRWSGLACWVACFCLLIFAPIEYVAFGIVAFGAAVGLQLIAAVLTRRRDGAADSAGDDAPR